MAPPSSAEHLKYTLNNGVKMPAVGLGTYRIRNQDSIMTVIDAALEAGYRMFDTAAVYGNEYYLKNAFKTLLPKYGLEREEIFITTKLAPSDHGGDQTTKHAFLTSLGNLGLDYVDLYLIHFPGSAKVPVADPRNKKLRDKTWAKLAELYDEGMARALGVSNYTMKHLQDLLLNDYGVKPTVNQVEWHPYYYQPELYTHCLENNIQLQAYCSFGGTSANNPQLLKDDVVLEIASELDVTPTQLLLAWALQQNVAVIPKSTNYDHIKQNIEVKFRIPEDKMQALNALGCNNIKYAWDPKPVA